MDIYVMNKEFQLLLPIIDFYKSIIWTNRYYKSGDFEMYVPLDESIKNIIKHDNFIFRDIDRKGNIIKNVKIIEKIELVDNASNVLLFVTGRDAMSILERRIIYPTQVLKGNIENCIEEVLNKHVINPENVNRKIATIGIKKSGNIDIEIDTQITGDTIKDFIENLCNNYKLGYAMDFNTDTQKFELYIYQGKDRTDKNTGVIFDKDFDNKIKGEYICDKTNYKNMGIVAGEGEGENRKVVYLNNDLTGIDRRELWVDAKDLQKVDDKGEKISDEEYIKHLEQRGNEKLSEKATIINQSADVELNTNYIFNKDYFLGDIVKNNGYENVKNRIVETIESITATGISTELTFEETEE